MLLSNSSYFYWSAKEHGRGIQLLDEIEEDVKKGGYIIDWHVCDIFPKSWIDLVVVLRADSTVLYDRLKSRNYPGTPALMNTNLFLMWRSTDTHPRAKTSGEPRC